MKNGISIFLGLMLYVSQIPVYAGNLFLEQVCGEHLMLLNFLPLADFAKGPYMIYENNNTEMVILWQADSDEIISQIEWGTTLSYGNGPYDVTAYGDRQYRYTIQGLTPGTLYYYRVNLDGNYQTGSFHAAPPATATSVSIYAYGDTRTQPDQQSAVFAALLADLDQLPARRQTVLLHMGDWVSAGNTESYWTDEYFNRSYPNLLAVHRMFPLMGARGNHEENPATVYRKYLPYPYQDPSECYYSFDYGPLHITVIDDYGALTPGSTQYNWIQNDIANSSKLWKIAMFHEPAYGAGPHENNITNQILTTNIFEPYGVELILAGHNHHYARCNKQPVQHITIGGGGAPLYPYDSGYPYFVTGSTNYHFSRIDVDGDQLRFTSIGTEDQQYDNFCITSSIAGKVMNTVHMFKFDSNPVLIWDAPGGTCSPIGYSIYRGTLPFSLYDHDEISCTVNDIAFTDLNALDSYYYLVVPLSSTSEGSYGTDSSNTERPPAPTPCRPQDLTACN